MNHSSTTHPLSFASIIATAAIVILGATADAKASSLLVNWGGKYLEGTTTAKEFSKGASTVIPGGFTWKYSDSVSKNPGADYNTAAPSAVFYGAFQATATGTSSLAQVYQRVRVLGSVDELWFSTSNIPDATTTFHLQGLVFWKQSEFIGENSGVTASSLGSISANISTFNGTGEVRFAIQSGGQWYLSQATTTSVNSSFTIENVNATNWALWSTTADSAPLPVVPNEFEVPGNTFTEIDAIGFYYYIERQGASRRPEFGVSNFEVQAIPETSSVALAIFGAVIGLVVRRNLIDR